MDQQPQSPSVPSDGSALDSSEKGTKKSGKVLPIILILVALAGIGFGVYGLFFKPSPTCSCPDCIAENAEKTEEQPPQETPDPTEQKAEGPFLATSRFKNLNAEQQQSQSYHIQGRTLQGIFFDDALNEREFTLDYFDSDSKTSSWQIVSTDLTTKYSISFASGQPVDAYVGHFGHDAGGARPIFLMDDGSVEYINPFDSTMEGGDTIKTNGKIDGLSNIIRLHQAGMRVSTGGGGGTIVAEDKDGYYYDLQYMLFRL